VSRGLDRRVRPLADTALLGRRRWQLAWGGASPNLLARAGWLAQYGAATASDAPPYWGMRCSLLPATDQDRPKALIHGRAIGASHARLARRWVKRLTRRLREQVSAMLTAPEQSHCRADIKKVLRHHC
jgi:hypothetical protein